MSSAIVEAEVVTFNAVTKNYEKKRITTILSPEKGDAVPGRCTTSGGQLSVPRLKFPFDER